MGSAVRVAGLAWLTAALVFVTTAIAGELKLCRSNDQFPVTSICDFVGIVNETQACPGIGLVEQLQLKAPSTCRLEQEDCAGTTLPPPEDQYGTVLPQDLPDVRALHQGLPETLDYKVFMKAEGATYFWYYRNLLNFANWAPCTLPSTDSLGRSPYGPEEPEEHDFEEFPVPEGWHIEDFITIPRPANSLPGSMESMPLVVLLKPDPEHDAKRHSSCIRWFSEADKAMQRARISGQKPTASVQTAAAKRASSQARVNEGGPVGAPLTPAQRLKQNKQQGGVGSNTPTPAPSKQADSPRQKGPVPQPNTPGADDGQLPAWFSPHESSAGREEQPGSSTDLEDQPEDMQMLREGVEPQELDQKQHTREVPRATLPLPNHRPHLSEAEMPVFHDESYSVEQIQQPYHEEVYEKEQDSADSSSDKLKNKADIGYDWFEGQGENQKAYAPKEGYDWFEGQGKDQEAYAPKEGFDWFEGQGKDQETQAPKEGYDWFEGQGKDQKAYAPKEGYDWFEGKDQKAYEPKEAYDWFEGQGKDQETQAPKEGYDWFEGKDQETQAPKEGYEESQGKDQETPAPEEGYHWVHEPMQEGDQYVSFDYKPSFPGEDEEPLLPYWDSNTEYSFARGRYDQHYTCGKDDSDSTAPELVLLIRRALSKWEIGLELQYNQAQDAHFGPGHIHAGFLYVAEALWAGGLSDVIEREVHHGCRHITLAGASLGGAVAQLLAVKIQGVIEAADRATNDAVKTANFVPARVTVVSFGSPAVGDGTWADNFNKRINARNIVFLGDLLSQFPCQPSNAGCGPPDALVDTRHIMPWLHQKAGGSIKFPGSAMPCDDKYNALHSWSALEFTSGQEFCSDKYFDKAVAAHICSYLCMTSQYVGVHNNLCWLDPRMEVPEGASPCSCAGGATRNKH